MKILIIAAALALTACTSIQVKPAGSGVDHICIRHSADNDVPDFEPVLQAGLDRNRVTSELFYGDVPAHCHYTLNYGLGTAWDMTTYLSHVIIKINHDGSPYAYADWHLKMAGGLSLNKWDGTATKIDPVIDQLFSK